MRSRWTIRRCAGWSALAACALTAGAIGACAQDGDAQDRPEAGASGAARGGANAQRGRTDERRPPAQQQAVVVANNDYVYALVGNVLYQYSAKDLKLVNKANLPAQGAGGRANGPGGRQQQGQGGTGGPGGPDGPGDEGQGGPRGHGQGGPQAYSLEQAISDNAQLHTIAFSGLAFITGDYGACTFLPPGKVCDYFGFQYMRDIDAAQAGHNPKFLDRVVANVLHTMTPAQKQMLEAMARQEAVQMNKLALMRLPLIKAFCRNLAGEIPSGSSGLNKAAVVRAVGDIFAFDAEISYERSRVFGRIAGSLTADQKAYLGKMKFGDFNTWPDLDVSGYKLPRGTEKPVNVAYMSCASEFFSWYAGSVKADVYFCPERHGTYFGGFYMKDMPAMGKRDYDISTSVTGDSGQGFLATLSQEQRRPIVAIPDLQRKDMNEVVTVRQAIAQELRKFLTGGQASKEKVVALGRRYGELDGAMSYLYAAAFATAGKTLTGEQRAELVRLRNLDGYTSAPAYIYSDPVQAAVPIPTTDHFFFAPAKSAGPPSGGSARPAPSAPKQQAGFVLRSPAIGADGVLPVEFTGDGDSASPPLEWSGAPTATKCYALTMHHVDPEGNTKWYWTLYNIPATVRSLAKGSTGVGIAGSNSVDHKTAYAPPHSKGPGAKTYILTLYALSEPLRISAAPADVTRQVLLDAMRGKVLASAGLSTNYTRGNETEEAEPARP
jgi:phosphatidylethanolamine-binding protein (PEBP) family uncharacterized protein